MIISFGGRSKGILRDGMDGVIPDDVKASEQVGFRDPGRDLDQENPDRYKKKTEKCDYCRSGLLLDSTECYEYFRR